MKSKANTISNNLIRQLEKEKAQHEDELLTRTAEVEYLKLVKAELEWKVKQKQAIAAAKRRQQQQ